VATEAFEVFNREIFDFHTLLYIIFTVIENFIR